MSEGNGMQNLFESFLGGDAMSDESYYLRALVRELGMILGNPDDNRKGRKRLRHQVSVVIGKLGMSIIDDQIYVPRVEIARKTMMLLDEVLHEESLSLSMKLASFWIVCTAMEQQAAVEEVRKIVQEGEDYKALCSQIVCCCLEKHVDEETTRKKRDLTDLVCDMKVVNVVVSWTDPGSEDGVRLILDDELNYRRGIERCEVLLDYAGFDYDVQVLIDFSFLFNFYTKEDLLGRFITFMKSCNNWSLQCQFYSELMSRFGTQGLVKENTLEEVMKGFVDVAIQSEHTTSAKKLLKRGLVEYKALQEKFCSMMEESHESHGVRTYEEEGKLGHSSKYLEFPFTVNQVILVDDERKLKSAYEFFANLSGGTVVGLDVEWKPNFSKKKKKSHGKKAKGSRSAGNRMEVHVDEDRFHPKDEGATLGDTRASTLQVSTWDQPFILDLLICHRSRKLQSLLDELLRVLFGRKDLIKLGFDFRGDMRMLTRSWPQTKSFQCLNSFIDIQAASALFRPELGKISLSKTCAVWLGRPLNKTVRMSDWSRRPLSDEQILYAALDAHCLTSVMKAIDSLMIDLHRKQNGVAGEEPGVAMEGRGFGLLLSWICQCFHPGPVERYELPLQRDGWFKDYPLQGISVDIPQNGRSTHGASEGEEFHWKPFTFAEVEKAFEEKLDGKRLEWIRFEGRLHNEDEIMVSFHCRKSQMTKNIAYMIDDEDVLRVVVVCSIVNRVDSRKVARYLGLGKRRVKCATRQQCVAEFGYVPGTMPVVGFREKVKVLIDESLMDDFVITGGGSTDMYSKIGFGDLVMVSSGRIGDFVVRKGENLLQVAEEESESNNPTSLPPLPNDPENT